MNFLGNIFMFIPVGAILRTLTGKKQRPLQIFIGTGISLLIEVLQLFNMRGTDIDDVLLNTLGTILGWLFVNVIYTLGGYDRKEKKVTHKYPRRVSKVGSLVVLAVIVVMFVGFDSFYLVPESIDNKSVPVVATNGILICLDTNEIIWQKESQEPVAPASCVKILNALTVLKYCDEEELLVVGNEINLIAADASRGYLNIGAELTVRQALIAMLLPSGNDAAYALAVYTGRKIASNPDMEIDGALEIFENEMNCIAKELGVNDSNFCSPDGYDVEGQYTTAYDLALIGEAALENSLISEIAGMAYSHEIWRSGETAEYTNTNELLLHDSPYYLPDCTGLKTGTSTQAGACLIMSFTVRENHYIGVIMGSTKEKRFDDSILLYKTILEYME